MEDDKEVIQDLVKSLEESVLLFSKHGKSKREIWSLNEFLKNINISFKEDELVCGDNPPDAIFRGAEFEIKIIDEKNRITHLEYKRKLEKSKSAQTLKELMVPWNFKEISLQGAVERIDERLKSFIYSPGFCKSTNILFYLNYRVVGKRDYVIPEKNIWDKWRSVSLVANNGLSYVFLATDSAPEFIKLAAENKQEGSTLET